MRVRSWMPRRGAGRAVRARAVFQPGDGWVLPYWMERQLDPRSPAFVPGGQLSALTNLTGRNWTAAGTLASPWRAIVDERGLVTPRSGGWSLDWWVGADDRWHFPSRESAVRQSLVDGTPVVETAMRIPSGDAVQRVYAVGGDDEVVVVEITNRSPVPVAIAFAVRPVNPEGFADVERIALDDRTVTVNGVPAVVLPRRPAVMAGATYADGDCADVITSGGAGDRIPSPLRCDDGLAQAAFVFPLPHTATIRVALPLRDEQRSHLPASLPASLPSSDDAARGWQAQTRRGMRLELPAGKLADLVAANRRHLLLFQTVASAGTGAGIAAASLLRALDWYGFHDEAVAMGAVRPDDEDLLSRLCRLRGLLDGGALPAATELAGELDGSLGAGTTDAARSTGLLAACYPLALLDATSPLISAAAQVVRSRCCVDEAVFDCAGHTGLVVSLTMQLAIVELQAGDRRALDRLDWMVRVASPTACWPQAIHPQLGSGCAGEGQHGPAAADFLAMVRMLLVREAAEGAATFGAAVRRDAGNAGLVVCSMLPTAWLGQGIEVHDAPTAHGKLSFAVRWHGDRPALLWELTPWDPSVLVRLTAPGLDPAWTSVEAQGEALLSPVPAASFA